MSIIVVKFGFESIPAPVQNAIARSVPVEVRDFVVSREVTGGLVWNRTPGFALRSDLFSFLRLNLIGREPLGILAPWSDHKTFANRKIKFVITKPTQEQIRTAGGRTLHDVIAPNLTVLFCGINPGLYSAAAGHNFARPGNRFWPALFGANFTDRLLTPWEERELLRHGCGITNIVKRATASADELKKEELRKGAKELVKKVHHYKPRYLAVVGLTAYRVAFVVPKAKIGLQKEKIGKTLVWVLPNPSGLNAHHQLPDLVRHFKELHSRAFTKKRMNRSKVEEGL